MKYSIKNADSEATLSTLASSTCTADHHHHDDSVGDLDSVGELSAHSNHSHMSNYRIKSVSFGNGKNPKIKKLVREVECLANAPEGKACMWYTGQELGLMRKKDIKTLKRAQAHASITDPNASIESEDMSWRGYEDIHGNWCRVEKSSNYTHEIVSCYQNQLDQGYSDDEEIRKLARGLNKAERTRALNLALEDAKVIGMSTKQSGGIRKSRSNVAMSSNTSNSSSLKKSSSNGKMRKVTSFGGLRKTTGSTASMQSLRQGLKSVRKSVSNLGNYQWSSSSKSKTGGGPNAALLLKATR